MALKTRQVLDLFKVRVDSAVSNEWKTHSTLRHSPNPDEITNDYRVTDPNLGKILKAILIMPAEARIKRGTTGRNGFSMRVRNIRIQAFIGIDINKSAGAPDRVLEDAIDDIVVELQKLNRMEEKSQGDTFHLGEMIVSPITSAEVSNHSVLVQEILTVVQDRILGRED